MMAGIAKGLSDADAQKVAVHYEALKPAVPAVGAAGKMSAQARRERPLAPLAMARPASAATPRGPASPDSHGSILSPPWRPTRTAPERTT